MKTAVSVPDDLFTEVERLAQRSRRSRSEVYSTALREYVARHGPDRVTEAVNRVVQLIDESATDERFVGAAAGHSLASTEW